MEPPLLLRTQASVCRHAHVKRLQGRVHSSERSLFAFREQFLSTPDPFPAAFFKPCVGSLILTPLMGALKFRRPALHLPGYLGMEGAVFYTIFKTLSPLGTNKMPPSLVGETILHLLILVKSPFSALLWPFQENKTFISFH